MRAVGITQYLPIDDPNALLDVELPEPEPGPMDLLVEVRAVAVNPVDVKIRAPREGLEETPRVLGWDAAGVVRAVGERVTGFRPGDEVYYAGALGRPGAQSELHVVDARIAAPKPRNLSFAEAAALPLTSLTAWELLFDALGVTEGGGSDDALLVIGGAGGVGSILLQLARTLTDLEIVATASREESRAWCLELGAHHIVDHRQALPDQVLRARPGGVRYIASLSGTKHHFDGFAEMLRPRGGIGLIDDPGPLDISRLKSKSLSLHWEFMFTRSMFEDADPSAQGRILRRVARLVEEGRVRSTLRHTFGELDAENLRRAHRALETGHTAGKIVLELPQAGN